MRLLLILLALPLFADRETKLVDKLVDAQRRVERANAASEKAGKELTAYCITEGKELRIKPNGLLGCVAMSLQVTTPAQAAAPVAPATAASKPSPKPETAMEKSQRELSEYCASKGEKVATGQDGNLLCAPATSTTTTPATK